MPKVRVSDHALVRYLQRVGGFDMDRLRAEMEERVSRTYVPGAPSVVIDGFRFTVCVDERGPMVTTIIDRAMQLTSVREGRRK